MEEDFERASDWWCVSIIGDTRVWEGDSQSSVSR